MLGGFSLHWHKEMEIILVLKGKVKINLNDKMYLLNEDDIILINCNEAHGVANMDKEGTILSLQINPKFCVEYFPKFNERFDHEKLYTYLNSPTNLLTLKHLQTELLDLIDINCNQSGKECKPYWRSLISFDKASDGLKKECQIQLKELQMDIGFEYI
ncbi:cupin domain-containing protein [Schnuerera ultunensis]|uniref:cupin domain-containing protein n=1 Tax=Schnuerera ultunensis TaxID=45497 RepID=UPI0022A8FB40|nr:cupin domain-containing protein [Schnuerera ultunensis]